MTERTINAERVEQLIDVFGSFDENVRRIEDARQGQDHRPAELSQGH